MKFFVLHNPKIGDNDAVTDYDLFGRVNRGEAPVCSACGTPTGMLPWLPPYRVAIRYWGGRHGDLAFFMDYLLASGRFVEMFLQEKLVGLEFIAPVQILKIIPKRMAASAPRYWVSKVIRGNGIFDPAASEAEYGRPATCLTCRQGHNLLKLKRYAILPDTWGGEDLFVPQGQAGFILASERFKEFAERHKFLNVALKDAMDYPIDYTFADRKGT